MIICLILNDQYLPRVLLFAKPIAKAIENPFAVIAAGSAASEVPPTTYLIPINEKWMILILQEAN